MRGKAVFFWEKNMPQQCVNRPKIGFFNLLKNWFLIFFSFCSVRKVYIICYIPVQMPYLGEIWVRRRKPKCS